MQIGDLVTWVGPEEMGCKVENPVGIIMDIGSPKYFGYGKYTHFELLKVVWTHLPHLTYPTPYDVEVISESR